MRIIIKIPSERTFKIAFICLLILNVYITALFIIARPCENINRAVSEKEGTMPFDGVLLYPNETILCFSENNKNFNSFCYYLFWPVHRFLEWRDFVHFTNKTTVNKENLRGQTPFSVEFTQTLSVE